MKLRLAILSCLVSLAGRPAFALPEVIDNSVYPPSAIPSGNIVLPSPSTDALLELTTRLEQLQAEVQQLTGKVEEQANTIAELKKHQSTMYADFDERMQHIENKGGSADGQSANDSAAAETSSAEAGTTDSAAPETSAPAAAPVPVEKPVAAPAVAKPKAAAVAVSEPENQRYQQAYTALRNGHTDESIAQFIEFLQTYPSGGLSGNAQYWLGEAYRVKLDNEAAKKAFNDVLEKYPNSAKVPDALLKLGYVEMDQKNTDKARDYFTRIVTEFPDTSPSLLAEKKLKLLDQ